MGHWWRAPSPSLAVRCLTRRRACPRSRRRSRTARAPARAGCRRDRRSFQLELSRRRRPPRSCTARSPSWRSTASTRPASIVAALHALGKRAVCYVDVGTWERWRPDATSLPAVASSGGPTQGWPGERWLDIRKQRVLLPIMAARFAACVHEGIRRRRPRQRRRRRERDGLHADRRRAALLRPGDRRARPRATASPSRSRATRTRRVALEAVFDFVVQEQCVQYAQCAELAPFVARHKAVFDIEYTTSLGFCGSLPRGRRGPREAPLARRLGALVPRAVGMTRRAPTPRRSCRTMRTTMAPAPRDAARDDAAAPLRVIGRWGELLDAARAELARAGPRPGSSTTSCATGIVALIDDVRTRGDAAVVDALAASTAATVDARRAARDARRARRRARRDAPEPSSTRCATRSSTSAGSTSRSASTGTGPSRASPDSSSGSG